MSLGAEQIAQAFCRHDFETAFPHLAPDVDWDMVGGQPISGRDDVIRTCRESAAYLSTVTTTFRRFRTAGSPDLVVIDSTADYSEPNGDTSTVASCDIFTFAGDQITEIRSYTIELSD